MLTSKSVVRFFCAAIIAAASSGLQAQEASSNWGHFRGPDGNGASETAKPPVSWSKDSENLKWKIAVPGKGHSSPIIWGDKVILMTAVDTKKTADGNKAPEAKAEPPRAGGRQRGGRRGGMRGKPPTTVHEFWVMCFNRNDGSEVWKTKVNEAVPHQGTHGTNTQCSASPVTDGKHIYASFGSHGLHCLDMEGKQVWDRELGEMTMRGTFGEGASPALFEDKLVVVADQEGQSYIELMNAKTGKKIWRIDRSETSGWATPRVVKHKDKVQVIVNAIKVKSYDMADGSVIWECGGQTKNPVPTPILLGDNIICMTGWRNSACFSIPLDSKGDISESDKISWQTREIGPYVPTAVLYKDTLYGTKATSGVVTVLDAKSGKVLTPTSRIDGIKSIYSSLVAANDHIYVTGRSGKTVVYEHGDGLDVVSTNDLGEAVDATLALADKQVFVRGEKHLFCFEDK